jgi:hypothetical protein
MNEREAAEVYATCCTIWREAPVKMELIGWTKALARYDKELVDARIDQLIAQGQRFMPRVPELVGRPQAEAGAVERDGRIWLPGTGWLGGNPPETVEHLAIDVVSVDGAADYVRKARKAARAAVIAARPPLESDPEIRRQVDEATAALRMPDETPAEPVEAHADPVPARPAPGVGSKPIGALLGDLPLVQRAEEEVA